jgi:hypothetical protein
MRKDGTTFWASPIQMLLTAVVLQVFREVIAAAMVDSITLTPWLLVEFFAANQYLVWGLLNYNNGDIARAIGKQEGFSMRCLRLIHFCYFDSLTL